jgi:hypothetical protein
MFSRYYTRNGDIALINGISQYYIFGKETTLYSGVVNKKSVTWDQYGRYKTNQLFGDGKSHSLDVVFWDEEIVENPGVYYVEFKK